MKKKMITLLAAAMLTMSIAGTASAAFVQGDLIRVVYDTVGSKEIATDLGSWSAVTGSANNTALGGGVDAFTLSQFGTTTQYSDLRVGYFVADQTTSANRVAIAGDANGLTSGSRKFSSYMGNAGVVLTQYAALATGNTAIVADKSNTLVNSFYNKMDASGVNVSGYGGWVTAANNPGGVLNLAALATTGYVDQTIYTWTGTNLATSNATAGTAALTLRTMANGTSILTSGGAAATTPIPPAFLLMGSGLLGMVGIRRKMAA